MTSCRTCGYTLKEALFFALLKDLGCRGPDPTFCPATKDHQHKWEQIKDAADE